jgi:hypothetical protein
MPDYSLRVTDDPRQVFADTKLARVNGSGRDRSPLTQDQRRSNRHTSLSSATDRKELRHATLGRLLPSW